MSHTVTKKVRRAASCIEDLCLSVRWYLAVALTVLFSFLNHTSYSPLNAKVAEEISYVFGRGIFAVGEGHMSQLCIFDLHYTVSKLYSDSGKSWNGSTSYR